MIKKNLDHKFNPEMDLNDFEKNFEVSTMCEEKGVPNYTKKLIKTVLTIIWQKLFRLYN